MSAQRVDVGGDIRIAHTVGISWPGDQGTTFLAPTPLSSVAPLLFFPEDEMHALQSGVPIAALLRDKINPPGSGRHVDVIAHSLGNMAIHSALTRPDMAYKVERYVMNEAAVPAIAFDESQETSSGLGLTAPLQPLHLTHLGHSDDQPFRTEWDRMRDPSASGADAQAFAKWNQLMNVSGPSPAFDPQILPQPRYEMRWSQTRTYPVPDDVDPSANPDGLPHRGPWKNFFAPNLVGPGNPEVHNTYSSKDLALTVAWELCQAFQKPSIDPITGGPLHNPVNLLAGGVVPTDSMQQQFWATLWNTGEKEREVWFDGQPHANITRQWAELAYWFPATSRAAGSVPLSWGVTNHDFSVYSETLDPVLSHGYMLGKPFPKVWGAFQELRDILKRQ
jgi:hypothetical protein